jgi:23S rRNA (cytidine1920-2'-O)/16S rRNA (cytidine1409-2'-O)-methyltransferase
MAKRRLDVLLVERGLVESREQARRLILAGMVTVAGQVADKAGMLVPAEVEAAVQATMPYVSRGGLKLEHALSVFGIDVAGRVALDVGASTGGFTDCLLQRGAARVYAVDVGHGELHPRLRQDPRVIALEHTNIRYLSSLPKLADMATVDVSFISLELVLPVVWRLTTPTAQVVALVKPQFEAGRGQVGRDGVVHDPAVHRAVLERISAWAMAQGWRVRGLISSPLRGPALRGPAGNVEFLLHLGKEGESTDIAAAIAACLAEATRI